MNTYPIPENEQARLETLRSYRILDTAADPFFDNVAKLASIICDTPMALVSLVDSDRQWFKARVGVDAQQTGRDVAFCAHAIMNDQIMEIPDASQDERFRNNPLVVQEPKIRFYAGKPLLTPNNCALGTLCVVDQKARKLSSEQLTALDSLGQQTVALLELHRHYLDLERITQQKDEFIRIASHDLKNPLQTILGGSVLFCKALKPGATVTEELYTLVSRICDKSRMMKRIIEDFLDFQAIEDARLKIKPAPQDLNQVAGGVIDSQRDYAASKMIELVFEPAASLPLVQADGERVIQVMENLVGNAIKYSPPGGQVWVRTFTGEQGEVGFEVLDSGAGIPQGEMDKLFGKYSRLSNRPTGGEKSSGLGLWICKSLVELHGGTIGARNHPEGGALFWFWLPAGG